jgi:hypothetical protein
MKKRGILWAKPPEPSLWWIHSTEASGGKHLPPPQCHPLHKQALLALKNRKDSAAQQAEEPRTFIIKPKADVPARQPKKSARHWRRVTMPEQDDAAETSKYKAFVGTNIRYPTFSDVAPLSRPDYDAEATKARKLPPVPRFRKPAAVETSWPEELLSQDEVTVEQPTPEAQMEAPELQMEAPEEPCALPAPAKTAQGLPCMTSPPAQEAASERVKSSAVSAKPQGRDSSLLRTASPILPEIEQPSLEVIGVGPHWVKTPLVEKVPVMMPLQQDRTKHAPLQKQSFSPTLQSTSSPVPAVVAKKPSPMWPHAKSPVEAPERAHTPSAPRMWSAASHPRKDSGAPLL